ncbi:hypothetical protein TI04_07510 [Achromatium sp. WMS2]|nr:hypothetical protein TI04_07510 [Achromatium sp. WMS2]
MRIVTFNINGIRARFHQLEAITANLKPDIIALQETKVADPDFPKDMLTNLGYHAYYYGQKGHYGVALGSKQPAIKLNLGLPGDPSDAQRRLLQAQFMTFTNEPLTVIGAYFPQGGNRSHPTKFPHKYEFYTQLTQYLSDNFQPHNNVIVMGDMNVAPLDLDVGIGEHNAKRWLKTGACGFLPEERAWLSKLMAWGLQDTFRLMHPKPSDRFSWFDYRSRGFEDDPKRGLRLDLILATDPLVKRCTGAGIDYNIRSMDKPSDHCPVWVDIDI